MSKNRTDTYTYHPDGQLASANYGDSSEDFTWDGLALIQRGNEHFINESHVGNAPKKLCFGGKPRAKRSACRARKGPRGNPVVSSKGASFFNDALGTTVGAKSGKQYSAATLSAFGARELEKGVGVGERRENLFFTGKPEVAGLGYAFLMRNYRAGLGKWQTADPLGYPDGWNALAYCNNGVTRAVDLWGCFPVDTLIKSKIKSLLNRIDADWVSDVIVGFFESTPCDDVHIYGYVDLKITNIHIEYYHYAAGDTSTDADDYHLSTPIDKTLKRTEPEVYIFRNEPGDRDGATCKIGDGTSIHQDVPGLSISDVFLGYKVTVKSISFDYNINVSVYSRYHNYIKE